MSRIRVRGRRVLCRAATIALGAVLWGVPSELRAQGSDEIVTDRPDFVESALTVGRGVFQFETSVAFARDDTAGLETKEYFTPTLFRYGIFEMWELRLETPGLSRRETTDPTTGSTVSVSGASDIALGAKWHTVDSDPARGIPDQAWLFHVNLPTGSREFEGQGARSSVRWTAEWGLDHGIAVGLMPGIVWDRDESGGFVSGQLGAVVGKSFTPAVRGFAELAFAQIAGSRHGGNVVTADLGVAGLVGVNWQWDTAVIIGLNEDSPDWGITVGLAGRF